MPKRYNLNSRFLSAFCDLFLWRQFVRLQKAVIMSRERELPEFEADASSPIHLQTSLRTNEGRVEDEIRSNEAADEEIVEEETSASSSDDDLPAAEHFDATYVRPPHQWAVLKAIRNREYGDKQHRNYQNIFPVSTVLYSFNHPSYCFQCNYFSGRYSVACMGSASVCQIL